MKIKTQQQKAIVMTHVLKASADGCLPTTIEIAKTGYWETPWHGDFSLTTDDFDQAVANFQAGVYRVNGTEPLAGTLDHLGGESPAAFRITDVYRVDDTLMATVTWTELGKEKLARDEYRYISFEFCTRNNPMPNPENVNDMFVNVVTGATLTNDPLFKKLKPVMASARSGDSNQGDDMNLAEIRAKALEDLTAEEKAFLEEHKAELTDEERTKFELTAEETDEKKETREKREKEAADKKAADEAATKEKADKEAADKAEADKLEASTKGMTAAQKAEFVKLQASVKALEADAQAGREAKKELLKNQLTASVKEHISRGAIKSDQLDAGVELLMASSEGDRTKLMSFIAALPDNQLLASAQGQGGDDVDEPVELTPSETQLADQFGNTLEEIAAYRKEQEAAKS